MTNSVGRLGVNYGNLASVKSAGVAPGPLPYGAWVPGKENLLIENKGSYQLRVTKTGNHRQLPKVKYYLNGEEVTKEELQALNVVLPSVWNRSSDTPVFNVKLENVIKIGR